MSTTAPATSSLTKLCFLATFFAFAIGLILWEHQLQSDVSSILANSASVRKLEEINDRNISPKQPPPLTEEREPPLPPSDVKVVEEPGLDPFNPLSIPRGQAQNLPSVRVENQHSKENVDEKRAFYGGVGDKVHLGGFTELDIQGLSPAVWKGMVQKLGVKSILDVGCGRGVSTSWFADHGVDTLCVEGSHDAVLNSVLDDPTTQMVEHDFSRGPWWPEKTFDAVWAVEFLEHVGLNFHFNYVSTFRKAALIFATSSRWGGWHHVEVHPDTWWIQKFELYGLRYSESLTRQVRSWAQKEAKGKLGIAPNGQLYNAQHIWLSMKVFINPMVAALPQHTHLLFEHGCFVLKDKPNRPCGEGYAKAALDSKMPAEYLPLKLTPEMDDKWNDRIKRSVDAEAAKRANFNKAVVKD